MDKTSFEALAASDRLDQLEEQPQPDFSETLAVSRRKLVVSAEKVKLLNKDQIVMKKADPADRSFSKEFAERLAESIEIAGLLNPPIAFNVGDGKYAIRSGRHRTYACFKILQWKEMPCLVMDDGPDELADAVDIASNLFTLALDEKQTRAAIEKSRAIYLGSRPTTRSRGRERKQDGFAGEIQGTLGVSERHARRLATTAAHITPDDRQTLEAAGVPQSKIDEIAAIKDPEAIQATVRLATSGVAPEEAVRRGKKIKDEKKKKAEGGDVKPAKEDQRTKPAEPTDDEWLSTHCKKLFDALPHKAAYKRDAVLYRRLLEVLVKFRTGSKKALSEAKKPGENGVFYTAVLRVVRASHPMDWLICEGCNGKGFTDKKDVSCTKCFGGGFKLKFEET